MHRFRSWTLDPPEWRTQRNRLLPAEGGDGSTLSLDFTTGVLDPRLTFTRLSNATFINSSGQVKYAEQNLFFNTNFAGISGSNPTLSNVGWSYGFTAGTATFNGDGSVTMSASGGRYTINRTTSFTGSGRRIIVSVDITSNGDTGLVPTQLLRDGTLTNSVYYINSTLYTSGTVVGPCTLTFVADSPTAGTSTPFFGVGTSGNVTATVTFARPRFGLWDGTFPLPYVVNTSSGASPSEYHGPRFDYDPTSIGTPRGLLIEGSAVNAALNSDVMRGTGWVATNLVTPSNAAGVTDPANGTNSTNYIANGTTGYHGGGVVSTTTGASTTIITWSCWVKANGYTKVLMAEGNSGRGAVSFDIDPNNATPPAPTVVGGAGSPTGTITRYPNNWYRIAMRVGVASSTAYQWSVIGYPTGATLGIFGAQYTGDSTNGIYVWGAQLEDGSGASSYIPTGASTGSRAYDHCYATGANFTSWFSVGAGTMVAVSDNIKNNSQNLAAMISDDSTSNYIRMGFKVGGAANEYLLTAVGGPTSFQGAADSGYAPPLNTVYRMAYAWDTNNFGIVSNGGAVVTDSSGTLAGAGVLTRLVVGGDFVAVPNDIYFKNGHIRSLKYWPYRLPNAQLQSITT